ncbi:MAG TPA: hypothetical protein VJT09_15305 [Pyrinomonadaceae bacterium]|nr:hypothetical protein [Pyrinomonadaceae bacterium]
MRTIQILHAARWIDEPETGLGRESRLQIRARPNVSDYDVAGA